MPRPVGIVDTLIQGWQDIAAEAGKPRLPLADNDPSRTRVCVGEVFSNADHKLDPQVAEKLKTVHNCYAEHTAWDFWAAIYYDPEANEFRSYVKQYQKHVGSFANSSIEEVIKEANKEFGDT